MIKMIRFKFHYWYVMIYNRLQYYRGLWVAYRQTLKARGGGLKEITPTMLLVKKPYYENAKKVAGWNNV